MDKFTLAEIYWLIPAKEGIGGKTVTSNTGTSLNKNENIEELLKSAELGKNTDIEFHIKISPLL